MLTIKNTEVFGLDRAIKASGNPKTTGEIDTSGSINKMSAENGRHFERAESLGKAKVGSGHDHYLLGIHVQFDIKYPQYWTIEAERYHNFEIISSQSKMHRLTVMLSESRRGFEGEMFNKYVDPAVIQIVKSYVHFYNSAEKKAEKYYFFMKAISNLPMGFEMWMTCDLTYLQIKTIYFQRKGHKLEEDWGAFCEWVENLPLFKELVLDKQTEKES